MHHRVLNSPEYVSNTEKHTLLCQGLLDKYISYKCIFYSKIHPGTVNDQIVKGPRGMLTGTLSSLHPQTPRSSPSLNVVPGRPRRPCPPLRQAPPGHPPGLTLTPRSVLSALASVWDPTLPLWLFQSSGASQFSNGPLCVTCACPCHSSVSLTPAFPHFPAVWTVFLSP